MQRHQALSLLLDPGGLFELFGASRGWVRLAALDALVEHLRLADLSAFPDLLVWRRLLLRRLARERLRLRLVLRLSGSAELEAHLGAAALVVTSPLRADPALTAEPRVLVSLDLSAPLSLERGMLRNACVAAFPVVLRSSDRVLLLAPLDAALALQGAAAPPASAGLPPRVLETALLLWEPLGEGPLVSLAAALDAAGALQGA